MEDLKQTEIEKLRQIISRTDKSGNEKLLLLMDFIYTREAALRIHDVVGRSEELVCPNCNSPHITDRVFKKECLMCGEKFKAN
jgi:hypothetical protein